MTWQAKLRRAEHHYRELEDCLADFFDLQPYLIATRRGADRKLVYYVARVAEIPAEVACITGDVLSNLRSALDHLAYSLWEKDTGGQGFGKRIYFPIDDDAASYKKNRRDKTRGISPASLGIIDSLLPYKGGNDTLWRIHTLNNRDKHRLLVTVGSSFQSMDIGAEMMRTARRLHDAQGMSHIDLPDMSLFLRPADNLFPLKVGDELYIGSPDDEENPKLQFRFEVLLHESGVIEGEPVTDVLAAMIAEVRRVCALF